MVLSPETVIEMHKLGLIVDVTWGGLLLGNFHEEKGIAVIELNQDGKYEKTAEFEGFEYVLNPIATTRFLDRLEEINNEFSGDVRQFNEYKIPENVTTLDCRPIDSNVITSGKVLIKANTQFIINRHSTKKYLEELEEMNKVR